MSKRLVSRRSGNLPAYTIAAIPLTPVAIIDHAYPNSYARKESNFIKK